MSRTGRFEKKEPEVLEKLEKFFVKVLEAEEIADKAAGGDGAVLNRAGGARKILEAEEIADKIAGEGVAVRDKTAGESVAAHDKTAGGVEAIRDKIAAERVETVRYKTAEEGEAIHEAADRVDEFVVNPSIEAILKPPEAK